MRVIDLWLRKRRLSPQFAKVRHIRRKYNSIQQAHDQREKFGFAVEYDIGESSAAELIGRLTYEEARALARHFESAQQEVHRRVT